MADFILKPMGVDHNMRHATWDERNWGVISDIYDIVEFCEDDDSGEFKYAYSMEPGQYVLEIHNYNEDDRIIRQTYYPYTRIYDDPFNDVRYNISIACDYTPKSKRYHFIDTSGATTFEEAELWCEYSFGTSLATLRDGNVLSDYMSLFFSAIQHNDFVYQDSVYREAWFGCYEESGHIVSIDGSTCYSVNGSTGDQNHEVNYDIFVPKANDVDNPWRRG
eukprot:727899_1